MMMRSSWRNIVLAWLLQILWPVASEASPKLYGDIRAAECLDAFHLAKWAYKSRASKVYATEALPEDFGSQMVLGSLSLAISGGNSIDANEDVFERLPHEARSIYWQKSEVGLSRIVVQEDAMGWRGDRYSLYDLAATVEKAIFASADGKEYKITGVSPILEESWRPPLVLKRKDSNRLWFITVGEPYQVLADWGVYLPTPDGYRQKCKVSFRNAGEGKVTSLPNSVQKLVGLLDGTLGAGNNEGTSQPTAEIRIAVQSFWANAAIRPWALTDRDRYNSKGEVDAGLEVWSKNGASYEKVYRKIQSTYPAAEKDLAKYYRRKFHLSRHGSEVLAKWVLEIGYCANYSFPNGADYFRYDDVDNNPWLSVQAK